MPSTHPSPARHPWETSFPDALIHASETAVKQHSHYLTAKAGDLDAASVLIHDCLDLNIVQALRAWDSFKPVLVSVHAEESMGRNAIPEIMADVLVDLLGWELERDIVQSNVVNHTGADGFSRLARQALFAGAVSPQRHYVIVDDFIGQGGTIANLRGHLIQGGGQVLGATVLTGKPFSAALACEADLITALRTHHGHLEHDWQQHFGFDFACLTQSEARYLQRTEDAHRIRDRVFASA
jgi:hypothetical protein